MDGPGALAGADLDWTAAAVPGTAAGAWRDAGRATLEADDLDGRDWWYRTRVTVDAERWWLHAGGLATLAQVWVDDRSVLRSDNMFVGHWVDLGPLTGAVSLTVRFAALAPVLATRRPRPRWKSRLVRNQNMRWLRTSIWGRMPATPSVPPPVGPWRPIELHPGSSPVIVGRRLEARPDADGRGGGTVEVTVVGSFSHADATGAHVHAAGSTVAADMSTDQGLTTLHGIVAVDDVELWWPHTHGGRKLYNVELTVGAERIDLGAVGFRTVDVDRGEDGFALRVNGVDVFARGAVWVGPDPVGLAPDPATIRADLERYAATGFNLVRVAGTGVYEDEAFWTACDQLGILVWCEAMFANLDVPDTPELTESITEELTQVLVRAANHPALAVVCGGSEVEQQAAMLGLGPEAWTPVLLSEVIPHIVDSVGARVPFVASSPTGGDYPFSPGAGVTHYFGVGAYLRPLHDARRAEVRFASECLAVSVPPEVATAERIPADAWKAAVPRDTGASWDFEDVRDHYVADLFALSPSLLRYAQPELALDFGRAATAEMMTATIGEWRRAASPCAGAVVLAWRDVLPGAGWGLL
ncbi:MAG: glycosyl hydrolase, partial [Actinomycetota bacterium]|nr:glycosyl hydrolase [Actinomycetota bacterium]